MQKQTSLSESVNRESLDPESQRNLDTIRALNNAGKQVIFAPNHLAPDSKIRQQFALADDFPAFQKFLKSQGIINNRPLARGDGDMEVGDSRIKGLIYNFHRKIFSKLGKLVANTLPVNINRDAPQLATAKNLNNIRDVIRTLGKTATRSDKENISKSNVTIYPYGNWYESGKQDFSEEQILPKNDYKLRPKETETFDLWRNSLKDGAFKIALLAGTPIIPCYVTRTNGIWNIKIGEPIELEKNLDKKIDKKTATENAMKKYIQAMQELKRKTDSEK